MDKNYVCPRCSQPIRDGQTYCYVNDVEYHGMCALEVGVPKEKLDDNPSCVYHDGSPMVGCPDCE